MDKAKQCFEDWCSINIDLDEHDMKYVMSKDSFGEYRVQQTYWMYKAFLAGNVFKKFSGTDK